MNILIISRTPWDNSNSFGNTFSNIFGGMEDVKIYNICCQSGRVNNSIVEKTYQMSESTLIKGFFLGKTGRIAQNAETLVAEDLSLIKTVSLKRTYFAFMIRDLIWKTGIWKKEKNLSAFLEEASPDIIYLPIYNSWYMCELQEYFIKKTTAKVVGHISDDVYSYPNGYTASPLAYFYKLVLRKKLRKLIAKAEYLEVFAENMQKEYKQTFNKECYLIGKCVTKEQIDSIPTRNTFEKNADDMLHVVYTGNIGGERFNILCELGRLVDERFRGRVVFDIYTQTKLTKSDYKRISSFQSIVMKGEVPSSMVFDVQRQGGAVLHIESFSKKSIYETKMSFSTKLIDYMLTGVPIIAIGPEEVNSINILKQKKLAIVSDSIEDFSESISKMLSGQVDNRLLVENIKNYLYSERNSLEQLKSIRQRFDNIRME